MIRKAGLGSATAGEKITPLQTARQSSNPAHRLTLLVISGEPFSASFAALLRDLRGQKLFFSSARRTPKTTIPKSNPRWHE
jgi:hypothetical protein